MIREEIAPAWEEELDKAEDENIPMKKPKLEEKEDKVEDENTPVESEEDEDMVEDESTPVESEEEEEEENLFPVLYPVNEPKFFEGEGSFLNFLDEYLFVALQKADPQDDPENEITNEEKAAYNKYVEQYNESEGFEIDPCPLLFLSMLKPLRPSHDLAMKNCIKAVQHVIKFMNQKDGTDLEFVEFIKANYRPFHIFFVTFTAKLKPAGENKLYQCLVCRNPLSGETDLCLFRERPPHLKHVVQP